MSLDLFKFGGGLERRQEINALRSLQQATVITDFALYLGGSKVEDISALRFLEKATMLSDFTLDLACAKVADIRPLPGVRAFVPLQVATQRESGATVFTIAPVGLLT